jgi:hypothetical protein
VVFSFPRLCEKLWDGLELLKDAMNLSLELVGKNGHELEFPYALCQGKWNFKNKKQFALYKNDTGINYHLGWNSH